MAAVKDAAMYLQKGGYGTCDDVAEERDVLSKTAEEKVSVVHFYHPEFMRCKIMQTHIDKLAHKHFRTRFLKFDITKGPWLAARLKIRELPTVMMFVGGQCKDMITGFESFGNDVTKSNDEFPTLLLEQRLATSGVIQLEMADQPGAKDTRLFGYGKTADMHLQEDSDSDDD